MTDASSTLRRTRGRPLAQVRVAAFSGLLVVLATGCGLFGGRREARERPPILAPRASTTIAIPTPVATTQPTPPPPSVSPEPHAATRSTASVPHAASRPSTPPGDLSSADAFGFTGDEYLELVTPQEMDVLRLRARGDPAAHLAHFLTMKEKENLRRRDAELTEIGAEPLRIGE